MKMKIFFPMLLGMAFLCHMVAAAEGTLSGRVDEAIASLQREIENESVEPFYTDPCDSDELSLPEGFCVSSRLAFEIGKTVLQQVFGQDENAEYKYEIWKVEEYQSYIIGRWIPKPGTLDGGTEYIVISQIDGRIIDIFEGL